MNARKPARQIKQREHRIAQAGDHPVGGHDDGAEPARHVHHAAHALRALDFVSIEDVGVGLAREHGGELPGKIGGIFHAAVHALSGERRHQMRGVAGKQDAALAPSIGDAGVKGVDDATLDFDAVENRRKARPAV